MSASRRLKTVLAGLLVVPLCAHLAQAQAPLYGDPRPVSTTGGYAGSEMENIYRQDVGSGYTTSSVIRSTLVNSRVHAPYAGSGPAAIRGPRIGLGVGTSAVNKPFSNYTPPPTVSPYLNLFRDDFRNGPLPNYQALVRPLQQQQETNQNQQRLLLQQNQALRQLNTNIQDVERRAATGRLVAPTGRGAWFRRPARSAGYLNTSRFYSQSGTAGNNAGAAAR